MQRLVYAFAYLLIMLSGVVLGIKLSFLGVIISVPVAALIMYTAIRIDEWFYPKQEWY